MYECPWVHNDAVKYVSLSAIRHCKFGILIGIQVAYIYVVSFLVSLFNQMMLSR